MGRSAVADAPGSLHGFPASLTSFVGRAQATAEIAAQLAELTATITRHRRSTDLRRRSEITTTRAVTAS